MVPLIIKSESNATHNALHYVYGKVWSKPNAAQAKKADLHAALRATVSIGLTTMKALA